MPNAKSDHKAEIVSLPFRWKCPIADLKCVCCGEVVLKGHWHECGTYNVEVPGA